LTAVGPPEKIGRNYKHAFDFTGEEIKFKSKDSNLYRERIIRRNIL
jgi:hypothetical protein